MNTWNLSYTNYLLEIKWRVLKTYLSAVLDVIIVLFSRENGSIGNFFIVTCMREKNLSITLEVTVFDFFRETGEMISVKPLSLFYTCLRTL